MAPQSCGLADETRVDWGLQQVRMVNIRVAISWHNNDGFNTWLWCGEVATLVFVARESRGSQVACTRIGVTGYNQIHHIVAYIRQMGLG